MKWSEEGRSKGLELELERGEERRLAVRSTVSLSFSFVLPNTSFVARRQNIKKTSSSYKNSGNFRLVE